MGMEKSFRKPRFCQDVIPKHNRMRHQNIKKTFPVTLLVVHLSHTENCMKREWDTFFLKWTLIISHPLCYFSKNATGELKLRSTTFQVERQVRGNTNDTILHAWVPTHKCFSFPFIYTPLLLLKISQLLRICFLHCITSAEVCTSYTNKQLK